jgi:hypothetical protein
MKNTIRKTGTTFENIKESPIRYLSSTIVAILIVITAMTGCRMNTNTTAGYQRAPEMDNTTKYIAINR